MLKAIDLCIQHNLVIPGLIQIYAVIDSIGQTITISGLEIPEFSIAYITINLDYALKGTSGWPEDASTSFYQDLTFEVSVLKDSITVPDIIVPFEVVGNENT